MKRNDAASARSRRTTTVLVLRGPAPLHRQQLELEGRYRLGRQAEPAIALRHRDQVVGLAERHAIAFAAAQAIEPHRRADQLFDLVVAGLQAP